VKIADAIRRKLLHWLTKGGVAADLFAGFAPRGREGYAAPWADDPIEQVRHYSHWVYAAIDAIANRVAATQLKLYKRLPGGEAEEVADHPALDLFRRVNPFHTRWWLWAQTINFLELTGNCYWYAPANALGAPAEIWIAHSQYMRVIPDRDNFIRGYEYRRAGEKPITFDPHEIVHLKYPNPTNMFYGRATLQAAAESVDAHEARAKAHVNLMQRGVYAGVGLQTDQELSQAVIERLATQIETKYASPERAGRPMVLEQGLKVTRMDLAPNEMALLESSRITRDEILSIFRVPAAVVGIGEDVARAQADAMDLIFARYCVAPRLQMIEDQLNQDLLPRYDPALFVRFDGVIPEDEDARRDRARKDFEAGLITLNQALRETGRPEEPGGDVRYIARKKEKIEI